MKSSMRMTFSFKNAALLLSLLASCVIVSGCASPAPPRSGPSMDAIYSGMNQRGQADAVKTMRRGISQNLQGGVTDPVFPMRRPDQIVPVWRPAYVNPDTGRKEGGQWVYIVDEPSGWVE